ncbi:ImuA family protein [Flavobacterium longum]|uniref:ImuA family protein n=1 Tax=Flavobacterium longum TaxID=1299340 RepID=UPI0039E74824
MLPDANKRAIARQLQSKINLMQGLGKPSDGLVPKGFEPFNEAFPHGVFPKTAIHEFISHEPHQAAATSAFITALAGKFTKENGVCLWVGNRNVYPPGLKHFGINPDRIVFVNTSKLKDILWTTEEALKCDVLSAVVADTKELGFTESRRLLLAMERSGVTGFIHRHSPRTENAVACTTRWKITPLPSFSPDGLPGIGYYCWEVQLLKVKNGKPKSWRIRWADDGFQTLYDAPSNIQNPEKQAG